MKAKGMTRETIICDIVLLLYFGDLTPLHKYLMAFFLV